MSARTDIIDKLEWKVNQWKDWVYSDEPIITIDDAQLIIKLLKKKPRKTKQKTS